MDNANNIFERKNLDGSIDYVVNIGNMLYNDRIVSISNLVIPMRQQTFFTLPDEKRFFAIINVYYSVEDGAFVFDIVKKSDKYIESCDSAALTNAVPIGQFVLQQSLSSFVVKNINLYSKMSTFSITTNFVEGDRGAQGEVGDTGFLGCTGLQGFTGMDGMMGYTGVQGETCVGDIGFQGMQGATGIYPDLDMLMYLKFKTDDINLTDYSAYEQDLIWGATGAGVTGIVYDSEGYTGEHIEFIDQGQSSFIVEEGIKDSCHSVEYRGGLSGYRNDKYIGFTGTIHTWLNINQTPIASFYYEAYTGMTGYPMRFVNTSLYDPKSLEWDINGAVYNANIVLHTFGSTGMYIVKLTATNLVGSHTKSELITVA